MTFHIRQANGEDAADIANLGAATFPLACYAATPKEDIERYIESELTPERFRAHILCPSKHVLVAVAGFKISGYVMLCRDEAPCLLGAHSPMELRRIYVDPALHGVGIADALMFEAIHIAADAGHDTIWLSVANENHRALAFYRKHGFSEVARCAFLLGGVEYVGCKMARNLRSGPGVRNAGLYA